MPLRSRIRPIVWASVPKMADAYPRRSIGSFWV
jgi:hypothetical protein